VGLRAAREGWEGEWHKPVQAHLNFRLLKRISVQKGCDAWVRCGCIIQAG
jgi:hypothetical protein